MICNTCGRSIKNEEANFCEYCGASFRGDNGYKVNPSPLPPPVPEAIAINQKEKPVSFLNWLGTYLIMFIPFIGSFIFLGMLIIWSVSRKVSESKKNWARANLVFMSVMFIMLMFIFSVISPDQFIDMMFKEAAQFNNIY